MDTSPGKDFTRLIEDLSREAPSYSVFHAIYLCEMVSEKFYPDRDKDKLEQIGLKFRPYENYVYPPRDIRYFEFQDNVMTFVINFMGLYGINSPLPRCYHEQVAIQQSFYGSGEVPLQNFYDIFNNRFYWLYYQAWKKYRYYLQLNSDENNKTMQRVFAFIGQGPLIEKTNPMINRFKLMQCSGILCNRIRNKNGLLILLKEFFPRFHFQVKEFIPHTVRLGERPYLGNKLAVEPFRLGIYSFIGDSMLEYMSRICIVIGPIDFDDFLDFVPNGKFTNLLKELLDLYLNDGLEYDIKLIVKTAGIKIVPWNDPRLRLGSTIWLGRPKQELVEVYYTYEKLIRI